MFLLGIFFPLILSSCGWLKKDQVQDQAQDQAQDQVQKKTDDTDDVDKQAQTQVEMGKFQMAIDLYEERYQKHHQSPVVRNNYINLLESIKTKGDQAFERNDFKSAGKIYEVLAKNWVHFADFSQWVSFDKDLLEKKIRTSRCHFTEEQVSSHLKAGDFQKAVDLYKGIYQKYPQDPAVRNGYISTLESIKTSGDRAFEKSDFALAGFVYEILSRSIPSMKQLNGSFSFNSGGLTEKIRACKKILFENGLKQYRSGNLNQAISLWKSILAFDPENQEIRKAVDMATLQYKNLQKANY